MAMMIQLDSGTVHVTGWAGSPSALRILSSLRSAVACALQAPALRPSQRALRRVGRSPRSVRSGHHRPRALVPCSMCSSPCPGR